MVKRCFNHWKLLNNNRAKKGNISEIEGTFSVPGVSKYVGGFVFTFPPNPLGGDFSLNQPKHMKPLRHPSGGWTCHLFCNNTREDVSYEHAGSPDSQILFTYETLNILKQTSWRTAQQPLWQLAWYSSMVIFVPPSKNNSIEGGGEHMGSSWGQNTSLKLAKDLATAVPVGSQHQLVQPARAHPMMRDQVELASSMATDYFAGNDWDEPSSFFFSFLNR